MEAAIHWRDTKAVPLCDARSKWLAKRRPQITEVRAAAQLTLG